MDKKWRFVVDDSDDEKMVVVYGELEATFLIKSLHFFFLLYMFPPLFFRCRWIWKD